MGSYFLVADVLGFSKIVLNLSHDDLDERMQCWTGLVAKARCEAHVDRIQLISDTVFVQVDDTDYGLEQLLIFSKLLLEYGIEQSFPIRGAISRGNVTWGEFTYGRAVIEGHSLERSQDWIGIACMNGLARISHTHLGGVSSGGDEPGCGSICVALRQSGLGLIV